MREMWHPLLNKNIYFAWFYLNKSFEVYDVTQSMIILIFVIIKIMFYDLQNKVPQKKFSLPMYELS